MRLAIDEWRLTRGARRRAIRAPQSKIAPRPSTTAFTLIELVVVIMVAAVLSALVVPNLAGQRAATELRESARSLQAAARYARDRATLRRQHCRLRLIEDNRRVSYLLEVESDEEPGTWLAMSDSLVSPTVMPAAVRLAEAIIDPVRREPDGQLAVHFYPDGSTDPAAILLTNGRVTWSVLIEPNTGQVYLIDAPVADAPNRREDLDA